MSDTQHEDQQTFIFDFTYQAETVLERVRSGKERTTPITQVMKRYGVEG